MNKLNTRKLKKRFSMIIYRGKEGDVCGGGLTLKKKRKNTLGLSLALDMDLIKSEKDIEDILEGTVRLLLSFAEKEWKTFIRKESS